MNSAMTWTLLRDNIPDILPMQDRSIGAHVSTIIHDLAIRLGWLSGDIQPNTTWMQLGCALEDSLIRRYHRSDPDRYIIPGELSLDDLFGTPDLVDIHDNAIEEIKLAWMSSKNGHPSSDKCRRYVVQLKAYCKMWGTNLGRLHICHVNGDYSWKENAGPSCPVWENIFTQDELNTNWTMLLKHRDRMVREGLIL